MARRKVAWWQRRRTLLVLPPAAVVQVFNFLPRGEPQERLSALEKRLFKSQSSAESKARTQTRTRERQLMSSYKSSMVLGE